MPSSTACMAGACLYWDWYLDLAERLDLPGLLYKHLWNLNRFIISLGHPLPIPKFVNSTRVLKLTRCHIHYKYILLSSQTILLSIFILSAARRHPSSPELQGPVCVNTKADYVVLSGPFPSLTPCSRSPPLRLATSRLSNLSPVLHRRAGSFLHLRHFLKQIF